MDIPCQLLSLPKLCHCHISALLPYLLFFLLASGLAVVITDRVCPGTTFCNVPFQKCQDETKNQEWTWDRVDFFAKLYQLYNLFYLIQTKLLKASLMSLGYDTLLHQRLVGRRTNGCEGRFEGCRWDS